jgi:hypothetical protein
LRMRKRQHRFWLRGQEGFVLSQSREEATKQDGFVLSQSLEETRNCKNVTKIVRKYSRYDLLVLSARPSNEAPSCLNQLRSELKNAGYRASVVNVIKAQPERYYSGSADEILSYLAK